MTTLLEAIQDEEKAQQVSESAKRSEIENQVVDIAIRDVAGSSKPSDSKTLKEAFKQLEWPSSKYSELLNAIKSLRLVAEKQSGREKLIEESQAFNARLALSQLRNRYLEAEGRRRFQEINSADAARETQRIKSKWPMLFGASGAPVEAMKTLPDSPSKQKTTFHKCWVCQRDYAVAEGHEPKFHADGICSDECHTLVEKHGKTLQGLKLLSRPSKPRAHKKD